VARTIRLATARPEDRVAGLRSELDALRTRRHLGYRESREWAHDAGTVVDEITAAAQNTPSRELLKLVELAINRIVKVILRADDSSGMIGDLAQQLLEAHAQICDAGVADPKALAKWMVRFGFDDQDFFTVDPVRYSTALGDNGLTALRCSVDDRSAHPDPDFAVRYTQERLAVLDGDIDKIVALLGGDLTAPHQFIRVAEAMLELRGEQHQGMPSATTYALLKQVARSVDEWELELAGARSALAERDLGELVDALLADGDIDAAWDAATAADTAELGDHRWERLAEAREPSDPAAATIVYLRLVESTLGTADRRAYRLAAKQLKRMQRAATAAGLTEEFDGHLAVLREQYRRRPTLIAILDKAGLG
jgi:hypothetical protein